MLKLKSSFLFRQKREDDVGFPSVCCEYVLVLLVNKEVTLAYGRAEQWKQGRKTKLNAKRKKFDSGRYNVAAQEKDARILLVKYETCGKIQIDRNGLI